MPAVRRCKNHPKKTVFRVSPSGGGAQVEGSRRGRALGSKLAYAGTPIHRVAKDFMIQGGDVHRKDGTSGESIYGKTFADEHLKLPFDAPGRLAMANRGPDANHSQFFVTCDSAPHCDGKHGGPSGDMAS